MPTRNSGGVISRGYGLFSRVITRGFGRFFKTESFKPRREKEPIIVELFFDIYSPVIKEQDFVSELSIPIRKEKIFNYLIKFNLLKYFEKEYNLSNSLIKNHSKEYNLNFNLDKSNLINVLNSLDD